MINRIKNIALPLLIVGLGVVVMSLFGSRKEEAKIVEKVVNLPTAYVKSFTPTEITMKVEGSGTIKPIHSVELKPRVEGEVIYISPKLEKGGVFKKGEVMVKIDPQDYLLRVKRAEADLLKEEMEYSLELQNSSIAKNEWAQFSKNNPDAKPNDLTLRAPQLKLAEANLKTAEAELELLKLNLNRCEIRAPFDSKVSRRDINMGEYITPNSTIISLNGYREGIITIPIHRDEVKWLNGFGSKDSTNVLVKGRYGGEDIVWQGYLHSISNQLEERSRMVELVIYIEDSGIQNPIFNLFVNVEISGLKLKNVIQLPRELLINNNSVAVVVEGVLRYKEVEHLRSVGNYAYIRGIDSSDLLLTSKLVNGVEGMKVKSIKE